MNNVFKLMKKPAVLSALVIVIVGWMLWREIYPAVARHTCSVVHYMSPPEAAKPAVTKEEAALNRRLYEGCRARFDTALEGLFECDDYEKKSFEQAPVPAKPAESKNRPASDREYEQCLREHGLEN